MLPPFLILYLKDSTFEAVFAGKLPTLYLQLNVRLTDIYITLVVLTRIFPKQELDRKQQPATTQPAFYKLK
jgi:hypothetical protein